MSDSHLSNFTFSFHPQSFAQALSNAISEHRLLPPRFSKPPLLSLPDTTENGDEDEDDNGRLQSDRPTKRVRTLSSAGLPTPEASPERHQAEVLWTEGWDDDLLRGQDIAKWSQYRGRSLSLSQGAQSDGGRFPPSEAGSGFQTPPPSPGAVSEYDGDLFVHGPKGGWKAIPVVPPGAEFYLSPDFEITANEDEQNVMPLVVSIGDTIGPRLLPINGPSGGDKGYFYFDPALSHITLALSDEVDQVDLYQQLATDTVEEDGKLFRYVGRFVADYRNSYLTAEDYASSTEEDQIQWLEYVYLRQPRFSVRLSRELIVEKFINSGTWFPKVHLTPVVHEVNLDDVMRSRERLLDLSIAPSEYPDDEQQIEGPTVVVRRESAPSITSPLSTLFFGSDVHSSGGTLPSFPTIPEHPGLVSPSRPPLNSRLFKETSGEHVPLPDFVRHFPLEGFEFSDVNNKAGDPAEVGFPDSPEVTYEHRLLMDKIAQEERELCEEHGLVHYRVYEDADMSDGGQDLDDTIRPSELERPSASLSDYRDTEDDDDFYGSSADYNRDSLASELNLFEGDENVPSSDSLSSSFRRRDIEELEQEFQREEDDEEYRGSDDDHEHDFFEREGSNPPEEWL